MTLKTLFLLFSCSSMIAAACAQAHEIPEIVRDHRNRELFTKVNDGTAQMTSLMNGRDFDGFYTYTSKYGVNNDVENAFNVEDGIIRLDGEAMGYFCTISSYRNYYLRVVTRWGENRYAEGERNSGILYNFPMGAEDALWPPSFECQLMENSAGDYWCMGGTDAKSPNPSRMAGTNKNIRRTENFENPYPEWNTVEILCYDDRSEHYVNGRLVNEAYDLTSTEGKILFQLEGAEIFFKTIELLPLK